MNTDPISDLFTRIRNAQSAGLKELEAPYSDFKMRLARLLVEHGFLAEAEKKGSGVQKRLRLVLAYREGRPAIREITRISTPGQRIYVSADEIRPVKRGQGLAIVSTSRGLMSGYQAKGQKLGGELIGKIW